MCASGCLGSGGDGIIVLPASRRNLLPDFLDLCFCLSRRALLRGRPKNRSRSYHRKLGWKRGKRNLSKDSSGDFRCDFSGLAGEVRED
jgi:hypothetical protein